MGPSFKDWLDEVDTILIAEWGLDHGDFPDREWWGLYANGVPPSKAAETAFAAMVESLTEETASW